MSNLIDRQQAIEAICMETCGVSLKNERCMVHCTEVQAVEKLPPAEPMVDIRDTQYNLPVGTDTISKQAAISAICNACGKIDCDQVDKCEKLFTTQEAAVKQGEIRPGDEVERCVDGRYDGRAMFLAEDNDRWTCLFWTGCGYTTLSYPKSQFKRTGRHYEIEPILEGIRNES